MEKLTGKQINEKVEQLVKNFTTGLAADVFSQVSKPTETIAKAAQLDGQSQYVTQETLTKALQTLVDPITQLAELVKGLADKEELTKTTETTTPATPTAPTATQNQSADSLAETIQKAVEAAFKAQQAPKPIRKSFVIGKDNRLIKNLAQDAPLPDGAINLDASEISEDQWNAMSAEDRMSILTSTMAQMMIPNR